MGRRRSRSRRLSILCKETNDMSVRVLDPTVDTSPAKAGATTKLTSLAGRTIGLLDNGKINVRPLLDHMERMLRSQYGVHDVVRLRKLDFSRPVPAAVLTAMRGCDAVISAVGDCGSCLSCSMHGAILAGPACIIA